MRVIPRTDVPGAYVVESGDQTYQVYLGLDPSIPRCDCPHMTYREPVDCKHSKVAAEHPNGTDE